MLGNVQYYKEESTVCINKNYIHNCDSLSLGFQYIFFRLRDKYDNIGRIVRGYSDVSRFNDTLFNGLLNFSKSCTLLADVKEMEVQRLQSKVNILV